MIELSQLDLQLAFMSARTLGEDIEDQPGTIEHTTLEGALEVALLARCQGVIEDDQIGLDGLDLVAQLLDLAAADKELGSQTTAGHAKESDHVGACRHGQFLELLGVFARLGVLAFQMNQDGPLTALMTLEEQCSPLSGVTWLTIGLLCIASTRQAHRTAGYDGGNGVFVDHLADSVLQQDDELVEGFDLALQLDAVDQIDGNRDAFLTQGIQVRVL